MGPFLGATIGGTAGTGLGALLGQAVSLPRQFLWEQLGKFIPAFEGAGTGADLIANLVGASPEDRAPWMDILGMPLEIATDPLTYAFGGLGGLMGSRPKQVAGMLENLGGGTQLARSAPVAPTIASQRLARMSKLEQALAGVESPMATYASRPVAGAERMSLLKNAPDVLPIDYALNPHLRPPTSFATDMHLPVDPSSLSPRPPMSPMFMSDRDAAIRAMQEQIQRLYQG